MGIVKGDEWVHKNKDTSQSATSAKNMCHDDPMDSDSMDVDDGTIASPSGSFIEPEWFTSAMTNLKLELIQHMDDRFGELKSEVESRLRTLESHFEPPSRHHLWFVIHFLACSFPNL